jgi:sugar phosphate isomerase/epimerase
MKYAVTEWCTQSDDIFAKLEGFAAIGFDAISFLYYPGCDRDVSWDELAAFLRENHLSAVTHGAIGECKGSEPVDTFYPFLEKNAEWKERHGNLVHIAFDPGYTRESQGSPMVFNMPAVARALRDAHDALTPLGVKVAIENWLTDPTPPPEYFSKVREAAGADICALLDLGHLNIAEHKGWLGGKNLEETIRAIDVPIIEVHVHDNDGTIDRHLPVGGGNADFERMLAALKESGFDGVLTIEIMPLALEKNLDLHEQLDRIKRSMEAMRDILERR